MDNQNYRNEMNEDDWKDREFNRGAYARASTPPKSYKDSSPEEVKAAVKAQVSKGVAAAAGAVEGLADEMEKDHVPETAGKAIELVGETSRVIVKTTVEQAKKTIGAAKGEDPDLGKTDSSGSGSSLGSGTSSGTDSSLGRSYDSSSLADDEDDETRTPSGF